MPGPNQISVTFSDEDVIYLKRAYKQFQKTDKYNLSFAKFIVVYFKKGWSKNNKK